MGLTSTCPEWAVDLEKLLDRSSVHGITLPVACHTATWFIPVQAITETAGMVVKLNAQFWEKHFQVGHIIG